jgi:hypothetical protein
MKKCKSILLTRFKIDTELGTRMHCMCSVLGKKEDIGFCRYVNC